VRLVAARGRRRAPALLPQLDQRRQAKAHGAAQHGKTEQVTDFLAWIAGKRPDLKTIFASYSDELGVKVNRDVQRIMTSERYVAIFGGAVD
jgi:hypothetical protein